MISRSRRDSVGGGSSRNVPPSPTTDAIQWRGGSSGTFPCSPDAGARVRWGGGSSRIFPWSPVAKSNLISSATIISHYRSPGGHAPFLETHADSVRPWQVCVWRIVFFITTLDLY